MSIDTARMQALHMVNFGSAQPVPSLKKAVWASILSANNALDRNALQAGMLAPYVRNLPLPQDAAELQALIAQCGWQPPLAHCQAIIEADRIIDSGQARLLESMPQNLRQWIKWRKELAHTFKGISWKTASFVALLMWPLQSPFAIVDRHILHRYGRDDLSAKISSKCKPAYLRYRSVERQEWHEVKLLNAEIISQGGQPCKLGIGHWSLWDTQRKAESPEHDLLSAYAY